MALISQERDLDSFLEKPAQYSPEVKKDELDIKSY